MRMRLPNAKALIYLEQCGYPISDSQYRRDKVKIEKTKLQRLHEIAQIGFEGQHLDRIDTCLLIERLMWDNWKACKDPLKRNQILKDIKELQPYISSYYEATKGVISKDVRQSDTSLPENTNPANSEPWTV